ncbi:MAG: hypothetical protein AAB699_00080 [Patescibacteria group bacterium]
MPSSRITWSAYDKLPDRHSPDWYFAVGIIALSLAVAAVLLDNLLFAVLIVISTVVLFLRTLQEPRLIQYELTNRGLWVNKEFRQFSAFDSFWIEEAEGRPALLLKSKELTSPLWIIPLEGIEPETVRAAFADYLLEAELHEPLSKKIMEFLGF